MTYGITDTGYVRKPLATHLQELEAAMITEFGPGVIQTPQSVLGQLNGLMADLLSELDERNLNLYQSYDPDQAEGNRLEMLARTRLISRQNETDAEYRKAITNEGQARVDVQDLLRAIKNVEGVTFVQVFVNETNEINIEGLDRGSISVAVIGGNDAEIAEVMRRFVVPGINTFGNTYITSNIEGFCRSVAIIRPVEVAVALHIVLTTRNDQNGCPPPSTVALKEYLVNEWANARINGMDPGFYTIRTILERAFTNIEIKSVQGSRDGFDYPINEPVTVGFTEIASIGFDDIAVTIS